MEVADDFQNANTNSRADSAAQVHNWTASQVCDWLQTLGTVSDEEIKCFLENEVDGQDLLQLDKPSMKTDLGSKLWCCAGHISFSLFCQPALKTHAYL